MAPVLDGVGSLPRTTLQVTEPVPGDDHESVEVGRIKKVRPIGLKGGPEGREPFAGYVGESR
jgi:hypothetical protein